jgi:hypothetical protein
MFNDQRIPNVQIPKLSGSGPTGRSSPQLRFLFPLLRTLFCSLAIAVIALASSFCRGGGVTVITHGYNSDVNGWITGLANQIPLYSRFPGTNFTIYKITLTTDGAGNYFYQWSRDNGGAPSSLDSGEIIVKLDWSQMAGGSAPYDISTYTVAYIAAYVLLQTNSISDLGGHALVEFPIHLIGHSRGGSLVSEISRELGTNGVWVDHLTTLDPHPLNNDGNFDPFFPTDASAANTPATVLYADDFWQNLGDGLIVPDGEPVFGAYVRQLYNLDGGYDEDHSNVHLWYHGTIAWATPTSDSEASISNAQRQAWWTLDEQQGTNAAFEYSLIGGSNRLSTDQPLGPGYPMIRDGFNQWWDLGAGVSGNRAAPSANNGTWPSLVRFDRMDTNPVAQGRTVLAKLFYQWAGPAGSSATLGVYLDSDWNPLNTNQALLWQTNLPGTISGATVNTATFAIPLAVTNAPIGWHSLFATLSAAGKTRYLYAPEVLQVLPSSQPPILATAPIDSSRFRITINGLVGQTIILQRSPDLISWQPIATNVLSTSAWLYTNRPVPGVSAQFYRAVLRN